MPSHSVFQQPWWLDAVAPGRWGEVSVKRDGRTAARLPYSIAGPRGLRTLSQPPLTPTLGPWIQPSDAKYEKALTEEMELMGELVEALPRRSSFVQAFSPAVTNGLPFHWAGYELSVRYTYRLHDIGHEEGVWDGFSQMRRRNVRKAQGTLRVRSDLGIDRFYALWAQTFHRQGIAPQPLALVERIEEACSQRGAREILFAEDERGRIHAVAFIVLDREAAYYLMGGADPELRGSGAGSLLLWEGIRRSAAVTEVFDFEGSMIRPIESFFRGFGARQTPYLVATRRSRRVKAARALRSAVRRS